MFFLDFRIVTFFERMESSGRVEGETGELLEKIDKDLKSAGSMNEGEVVGLASEEFSAIGEVLGRGGKSSKVKGGGDSEDEEVKGIPRGEGSRREKGIG